MTQIQKLQKIEYNNYYSVYNKNGHKICDTADVNDAILMCSFDSTRTYRQVKIIMDQVLNISSQKMEDDKQLKSQNILPERTAEPFIV